MSGAPSSAHAAHAAALLKFQQLWEILLADDDEPDDAQAVTTGEHAERTPSISVLEAR